MVWGCYANGTEIFEGGWTCNGDSDPDFENGSPGQFSESKLNFMGQFDYLHCVTTESGGVEWEGITLRALHVMTYGSVPAKKVNVETSNAKAAETLEVKDP